MAIVKCNWSGGKDSSCATHLHILQGDKCIVVNYTPMFTDKIPLLLKEHYEFILQTAKRFEQMGAEVHLLRGLTYWDFFHKRVSRGDNIGRMFCFPPFIVRQCSFKNYSKVRALNSINHLIKYDYEDIGIAFDEIERHGQLTDTKKSILVEKKITEYVAKTYCIDNSLYSPHYSKYNRDGCTLCPQAKAELRREWLAQYPEAFELVLQLQETAKKERPNTYPLRNHKWFIEEDNQLNFFTNEPQYIIN